MVMIIIMNLLLFCFCMIGVWNVLLRSIVCVVVFVFGFLFFLNVRGFGRWCWFEWCFVMCNWLSIWWNFMMMMMLWCMKKSYFVNFMIFYFNFMSMWCLSFGERICIWCWSGLMRWFVVVLCFVWCWLCFSLGVWKCVFCCFGCWCCKCVKCCIYLSCGIICLISLISIWVLWWFCVFEISEFKLWWMMVGGGMLCMRLWIKSWWFGWWWFLEWMNVWLVVNWWVWIWLFGLWMVIGCLFFNDVDRCVEGVELSYFFVDLDEYFWLMISKRLVCVLNVDEFVCRNGNDVIMCEV